MAENFLFYLFSSIALISGVMVIRSKNPVHSVLFLILVFCNAAGLLILLHLDFFAMIFLVVYVGAIAVLFLFVVMMLHIKLTEMNENILRYLPVGGIIGLIFLLEVLLVVENELIPLFFDNLEILVGAPTLGSADFSILSTKGGDLVNGYQEAAIEAFGGVFRQIIWDSQSFQYTQWPLRIENITNIEAIGQVLYTYYFYFFIMASLILLIAMIGAIVLTHRSAASSNREATLPKRQQVFEQNTREFSKTIQKLRF